jgi:hypothetical protein
MSDTTMNAIIGGHRNTDAAGYGINCTVVIPVGQVQTAGGINMATNTSGNWGGTCNETTRITGGVGIGAAIINAPLSFANDIGAAGAGNKIRMYDDGVGTYVGLGVSSGAMDLVGLNMNFFNGPTKWMDYGTTTASTVTVAAPTRFGLAAGTPVHIVSAQATAPALTSCGTNPSITGTDTAGIVTMGTGTPTGCIITFNVAYVSAPYCVVSWIATPLGSQSYATSNTAITLTQTATSSNKVQYVCVGQAGG